MCTVIQWSSSWNSSLTQQLNWHGLREVIAQAHMDFMKLTQRVNQRTHKSFAIPSAEAVLLSWGNHVEQKYVLLTYNFYTSFWRRADTEQCMMWHWFRKSLIWMVTFKYSNMFATPRCPKKKDIAYLYIGNISKRNVQWKLSRGNYSSSDKKLY